MKSRRVISEVELVARVCRPDGLITQPTYFFFPSHHWHANACISAKRVRFSKEWQCFWPPIQTVQTACFIQGVIQRIDYNPSDNPCILPVMCTQQHPPSPDVRASLVVCVHQIKRNNGRNRQQRVSTTSVSVAHICSHKGLNVFRVAD